MNKEMKFNSDFITFELAWKLLQVAFPKFEGYYTTITYKGEYDSNNNRHREALYYIEYFDKLQRKHKFVLFNDGFADYIENTTQIDQTAFHSFSVYKFLIKNKIFEYV